MESWGHFTQTKLRFMTWHLLCMRQLTIAFHSYISSSNSRIVDAVSLTHRHIQTFIQIYNNSHCISWIHYKIVEQSFVSPQKLMLSVAIQRPGTFNCFHMLWYFIQCGLSFWIEISMHTTPIISSLSLGKQDMHRWGMNWKNDRKNSISYSWTIFGEMLATLTSFIKWKKKLFTQQTKIYWGL